VSDALFIVLETSIGRLILSHTPITSVKIDDDWFVVASRDGRPGVTLVKMVAYADGRSALGALLAAGLDETSEAGMKTLVELFAFDHQITVERAQQIFDSFVTVKSIPGVDIQHLEDGRMRFFIEGTKEEPGKASRVLAGSL
jgi:hypothetical protein